MGILGWTPDQFWRSTMHDLTAALEGWNVGQGDTRWKDEAMADRIDDLRAGLEALKIKQRKARGEQL